MDLFKVLEEMHEERRRLETIIARLEQLESPAKNRGLSIRKGMNSEGRKAASQRMKRYWAERKQKESELAALAPESAVTEPALSPSNEVA